jgi:hypothetical protein
MTELSKELNSKLKSGKCKNFDIKRWTELIQKNQRKLDQICAIKIQKGKLPSLDLITTESGRV